MKSFTEMYTWEFPCEPGDKVYLTDGPEGEEIYEAVVKEIVIDSSGVYAFIGDSDGSSSAYTADDFGEVVFGTYEEAKASLEDE